MPGWSSSSRWWPSFPTRPWPTSPWARPTWSGGSTPRRRRTLEEAVKLDPEYAAALVSLGDAYAGAGQADKAREVFARAKEKALAQNHPGLAEEIDERVADLG